MAHKYYIGIAVPSPLHDQITLIQQKLYDPTVTIQPLEPHITLLPPPAVKAVPPEQLGARVTAVVAPFMPLTIRLTGIEVFAGHSLAIKVESEVLYAIQKQLVALLPPGTETTYRPFKDFTPHITLLQAIRGHRLPRPLIAAFEEQLGSSLFGEYVVDHLTLYRWRAPRLYDAQSLA